MSFLKLFPSYLLWHYTVAFKDIVHVSKNFLFFVSNFFSIRTLLSSLFAPWERLGEEHHKGEGIGGFASTLVVNTIMRIVGFCMRIVLITIGTFCYVLTVILSIVSIVLWPLLPFVVILLFVFGTNNLFE